MALIIRKYGGSSVSTVEKIKYVAEQIKNLYQKNNKIVCVISAMGNTTDSLHDLAYSITSTPDKRELDMLLSIGERKSISLMALALHSIGVPSVSFTGSQIGLITNNLHGDASILEIKADRIRFSLNEGKVVVVAGYQGVSTEKEITTLGRGGTDTTAIALAASLNADRCELMKDVDGLFNISPEILKNAYLRKSVHYDDLVKIAEAGAKIISLASIKLAKKHSIKLGIGNTYTNKIGTLVSHEKIQDIKFQIVRKNIYISNVIKQSTRIILVNGNIISISHSESHEKENAILYTIFHKKNEHHEFLQKLLQSKPIFGHILDTKSEFIFKINQKEKIDFLLSKIFGAVLDK